MAMAMATILTFSPHIDPNRQRELEAFRKAQEERERRIKERRLQFASAVKMQKYVRAFFATRSIEAVKAERKERANEAAIQVQTAWRGAIAKETVRKLKAERQENGAVLIQTHVRGALARRRRLALEKERSEREERAAREASATAVQTQWRARRARDACRAHRRQRRRAGAGLVIQCWARSFLAQRRARSLAMARQQCQAQRSAAIITLQCAWRSSVAREARRDLDDEHRAAISTRIQAYWRGSRARILRIETLEAVTRAQGFVRMSLARRAFVASRAKVITGTTSLQARWRGISTRRRSAAAAEEREREREKLQCLEREEEEEEEYESDGPVMQNRPVGLESSQQRTQMAYPEGYLAWRDDGGDEVVSSQSHVDEGAIYEQQQQQQQQDRQHQQQRHRRSNPNDENSLFGREETKHHNKAEGVGEEMDDKVAARVQAMWRGSKLRQRLDDALSTAKYVDEDDFDYSGVNMNEFLNDLGLDEEKLQEYEDGDFGRPLDFAAQKVRVRETVEEREPGRERRHRQQGWADDESGHREPADAAPPPPTEQPARYDYSAAAVAAVPKYDYSATTEAAPAAPKYDYGGLDQKSQERRQGAVPTLRSEQGAPEERAAMTTARSDAPSTSRRTSKKEREIDNVCNEWGFSKETAALMYKRKQRMLGAKKKRKKRRESSATSRYREFAKSSATAAPPRRRGGLEWAWVSGARDIFVLTLVVARQPRPPGRLAERGMHRRWI